MPPSTPGHTFIDEERKIELYEEMRQLKADGENNAACYPGFRILYGQGMFVWMTMSWMDLMAADHEAETTKARTSIACVSEMVSMMASLIYQ